GASARGASPSPLDARAIGFQGGKRMTFDECHRHLVAIRRKQGTRYPLVRVDYGGSIYQGRLTRSDSDPEHRQGKNSPYGVLVLETLGLSRGPEMILQIANISDQGIGDLNNN